MVRVFLYDNRLELGRGVLAQVDGFKLTYVSHTFSSSPEAIRNDKKSIYGYVYEVDESVMKGLDAYYGVGIGLHHRIVVKANFEGGLSYPVTMWEYTYLEVAKK